MPVKAASARHLLEIDTLGAYSAIWFAGVTSVQVDPRQRDAALANIEFAGLSDRIVLPTLARDVEQGQRPKFDFVGADKENNWNYCRLVLPMVKPGTCTNVDNVVRQGQLACAEASDQATANGDGRITGCRTLMENVGRDERVEATVLQALSENNYDDFLTAVVK